MSTADHLNRVYGARSPAELAEAYDAWAASYDRDMEDDLGWGAPEEAAQALAAHLEDRDAPILDLGAGTGLVGRALAQHGFRHVHAADLSLGMLEVARAHGVYLELHPLPPGPLPFPDGHYAALVAVGVLTEGHAPPEALRGWLPALRPGGLVVFSLRPDLTAWREMLDVLEAEGEWSPVWESPDLPGFRRLQSRPYRIHVYRRLGR